MVRGLHVSHLYKRVLGSGCQHPGETRKSSRSTPGPKVGPAPGIVADRIVIWADWDDGFEADVADTQFLLAIGQGSQHALVVSGGFVSTI